VLGSHFRIRKPCEGGVHASTLPSATLVPATRPGETRAPVLRGHSLKDVRPPRTVRASLHPSQRAPRNGRREFRGGRNRGDERPMGNVTPRGGRGLPPRRRQSLLTRKCSAPRPSRVRPSRSDERHVSREGCAVWRRRSVASPSQNGNVHFCFACSCSENRELRTKNTIDRGHGAVMGFIITAALAIEDMRRRRIGKKRSYSLSRHRGGRVCDPRLLGRLRANTENVSGQLCNGSNERCANGAPGHRAHVGCRRRSSVTGDRRSRRRRFSTRSAETIPPGGQLPFA